MFLSKTPSWAEFTLQGEHAVAVIAEDMWLSDCSDPAGSCEGEEPGASPSGKSGVEVKCCS
jgi:hypothetical protein